MTTNVYNFDINLEKIETESELAVQRESKYWRENDAKLRAVHQKVASYEEFKNIVAASHLKPLNKNENLGQITNNGRNNRYSHWNNFATENKNASVETDFQKKSSHNALMKGSKSDYVNLPEPELYMKIHDFYHNDGLDIFHTEIPSEVLIKYCRAILNKSELQSDEACINWKILTYIVEHAGRLSLTMAFMSSEEKSTVKQAIDIIHCKLGNESITKSDLLKMFSLE